jgi:hypothetical protein
MNIVLIIVSRLLSCAHFNVQNFSHKNDLHFFFSAVSGSGRHPASLLAQAAVAASQPACSAAADGSQPACPPFHASEQ